MLLPVFLLLFPGPTAWDAPSSAEVCGRCHRAIYGYWKTSAHAQAIESRLFQDVLERAEADFPTDGRKVCLGCHSPIASQTNDDRVTRAVTEDGVTCDYCHSIHQVTFDGPNPKALLTFSDAKTGPLSDAVSIPHKSVYSPVHASGAVCAPCHEYRNASGFPVQTTYAEWQDSRYGKEGRPCQSCHMARVAGDVVDPHVTRTGTAKINLHEMPGSHSVEHLAQAIQAQLSTARQGPQLKVTVEIANETAGHYLPTGSPLRQLVMELGADSAGGQHIREQRIYAGQVADRHGTVLRREHFAFLKASKLVSDTRLAPGEKRTETFLFPIPEGGQA
jgi:Zn-finger protein